MTLATLRVRAVADLDPQVAALPLVLQQESGRFGETAVAATLLMLDALRTVFLALALLPLQYITVLFYFMIAAT